MATLVQLEAAGALFKLDPGLPPSVQEVRLIYTSPKLRAWLEGPLMELESNTQLTPAEQVGALVEDFCAGETLMIGPHMNMLDHVDGAMWKLKTKDIRLFGWFASRDIFVGVCGHAADFVKKHKLYHGLAGEVQRFRDQLDLDEPKFVAGEDTYGVVSNYAFP